MLTREQLKAVRKIQIRTSHLVTDLFAGQYQSVFKGRGMEFAEVRLYQPGDDVRMRAAQAFCLAREAADCAAEMAVLAARP